VFSKSVRAIVWADGFSPFAETKGQKSQGRNNLKFVDFNGLETGRLRRRSCKLRRTGGTPHFIVFSRHKD